MNVLEALALQESEALATIKATQIELARIRAAIKGVTSYENEVSPKPAHGHKYTVNEAVMEAVKNGHKMPKPIFAFIQTQLGMDTSINSVRTRVSRLGSRGKIIKIDGGWGMPQNS